MYGLANIYPKKLREGLQSQSIFAASKTDGYFWSGIIVTFLFLTIITSILAIPLISFELSDEDITLMELEEKEPQEILDSMQQTKLYRQIGFISVVLAILLTVPFGIHTIFFLRADKRANNVNTVLPNALNLIASNLRAGVTPFEAMKMAAIPEFGVFGDELKVATSKSSGVKNFDDYLLEMNTRVNSLTLHRVVRLIVSSLKSGGKLAEMLEGLSTDITEKASLKKELEINIKTNMMFIMFIIIVGTPMLLSISIYFVDSVSAIQDGNDFGDSDISGFGGGEIVITSDFIERIAYVMLFLTSLLAAFFLGAVLEGDIKRGLRYAPIMIIGSYTLFIIAQFIINNMLG